MDSIILWFSVCVWMWMWYVNACNNKLIHSEEDNRKDLGITFKASLILSFYSMSISLNLTREWDSSSCGLQFQIFLSKLSRFCPIVLCLISYILWNWMWDNQKNKQNKDRSRDTLHQWKKRGRRRQHRRQIRWNISLTFSLVWLFYPFLMIRFLIIYIRWFDL